MMHFHAAVMSLYVILLIAQPFLIAYKKYEVHRLLGKFSYFLMPIIVLSFFAMIYKEYNDKILHKITNAEFIEFTFLNIGKLSLFVGFYLLAMNSYKKYCSSYALHYSDCIGVCGTIVNTSCVLFYEHGFFAILFIFIFAHRSDTYCTYYF